VGFLCLSGSYRTPSGNRGSRWLIGYQLRRIERERLPAPSVAVAWPAVGIAPEGGGPVKVEATEGSTTLMGCPKGVACRLVRQRRWKGLPPSRVGAVLRSVAGRRLPVGSKGWHT
jgi:hypothetical protein